MAKPKSSKVKPVRIALVGGETLLGNELQQVIEAKTPAAIVTAYAANAEGNFTDHEGEAVFLKALTAEALGDEDAVILAGAAEGSQKAYTLAKETGEPMLVLDCMGHLEQEPEARIVSPQVNKVPVEWPSLLVLAQPAAVALALILIRLGRRGRLRNIVAEVFEPASERGKRGITELHTQTTTLLSFKPLPKEVYDAQLAFSMLAQYGDDAPDALATIEQRIERHLASLLSQQVREGALPMPSLRLVQAPVFHGYSVSIWAEFEQSLSVGDIREALTDAAMDVRGDDLEAPSNVGAAGQSEILIGDVRMDRNNPRAVWIWAACDNLRLVADGVASILADAGTSAS